MTATYFFRLNDAVYVFYPDTHDVMRVHTRCCERLEHPDTMRRLRLKAVEITRQQAEQAVPGLERMAGLPL
jgi:hypothetical protein